MDARVLWRQSFARYFISQVAPNHSLFIAPKRLHCMAILVIIIFGGKFMSILVQKSRICKLPRRAECLTDQYQGRECQNVVLWPLCKPTLLQVEVRMCRFRDVYHQSCVLNSVPIPPYSAPVVVLLYLSCLLAKYRTHSIREPSRCIILL